MIPGGPGAQRSARRGKRGNLDASRGASRGGTARTRLRLPRTRLITNPPTRFLRRTLAHRIGPTVTRAHVFPRRRWGSGTQMETLNESISMSKQFFGDRSRRADTLRRVLTFASDSRASL